MTTDFQWIEPSTLDEALEQLGDSAVVKAGGIDVMDRLKEGLEAPARLVNILNIAGLDGIEAVEGGLRIGSLVTLARLAADPAVKRDYRALAEAAAGAATPQIRNVATLGGNLLQRPRCWYFRHEEFHCLKKGGDHCFAQDGENEYHAIFHNATCAIVHPSATACALLALDASVDISGPSGSKERRTIPAGELFALPDVDVSRETTLAAREIVTGVRLPSPAPGASSAYLKLGEKESFDWPLAEVAVRLERTGGRVERAAVVMGAAAPIPLRSPEAERELTGAPITEESARAASRAAIKDATPLARNGYKVAIFEAVIRRAILEAAGTGGSA